MPPIRAPLTRVAAGFTCANYERFVDETLNEAVKAETRARAHDLGYQIDEVDERVWQSQATSFAGLLGQLELFCSDYGELDDDEGDKSKLDTIIAGVKALVPGDGKPEEGGAA